MRINRRGGLPVGIIVNKKYFTACFTSIVTTFGGALLADNPPNPALPTIKEPFQIPCCQSSLPLDTGQIFAGPLYLLHEDKVSLFEQVARTDGQQKQNKLKLVSTQKLKGAPPAFGLKRARVKWRNDSFWLKSGRRIFKKDLQLNEWFLRADSQYDFFDFDVDSSGQIFLIGTADPAKAAYRNLVEIYSGDGALPKIIASFPDEANQKWPADLNPVVAATLLIGYESVLINDYIVLFNPLARKLFVYSLFSGNFKEIKTTLSQRTFKSWSKPQSDVPTWPADLCWQIIPKDGSSAWLVLPACACPQAEGADATADASALRVVSLNLSEAEAGEAMPLPGIKGPVFLDADGNIVGIEKALDSYNTHDVEAKPPLTVVNSPKKPTTVVAQTADAVIETTKNPEK